MQTACGRIDKIVEWDNRLYLCDTKTTKTSLTDLYFRNFQPNNQSSAYIWAARNVLGLDIAGFIVDAIQTGVDLRIMGSANMANIPI